MKDILREIFDDEYDITPKRDQKQLDLNKQIGAEWDKVQRMFWDDGRTGEPSAIIRRGSAWGPA